MQFELIGTIEGVETIARERGIRELKRLRRIHGDGRWRKRKGFGSVRLEDGAEFYAERHWYEATGIGRKEMKIKRLLRAL